MLGKDCKAEKQTEKVEKDPPLPSFSTVPMICSPRLKEGSNMNLKISTAARPARATYMVFL